MPSYLDFDTTKKFRDKILNKTLKAQNGPQTFSATNYSVSYLNEYSNIDLGDVDDNIGNDLLKPQTNNIYKPLQFSVLDSLNTLPRRANLSLYPYFQTNQNHSLVSVLLSDDYDNESELFKFAANYIKNEKNGPVQSRISQNLYSSTYGKVRILDALEGNGATLSNIISGKEPLVELNNNITVPKSGVGKMVDFAKTVAGVEFAWSEIPGDYLTKPANPIMNTVNGIIDSIGNIIGIKNIRGVIKPSELFLEYMGSGQKRMLFENLSYSKYAPNYSEYKGLLNSLLPLRDPYIGNDTTNDVKNVMTDGNDRIVRSSYYLNMMFDPISTTLFERQRNISDGGGITGKLTWISRKSRNKIGIHNNEFGSESSNFNSSLSTNYDFKENSILGVTQDLLNSMPSDSTSKSHVSNAIDQTSRVFKEGEQMLSKGSAIKFVNKFNKEESGVEYCRVWTKDCSYMNNSDTMKKTGLIRKYDSSIMSTPWNLNIYPVSNGNKSFDGSTNMERYGDGFRAKKYMFSIENLAWKTSNKPEYTYEDLPYCERGPNGGRIMWFPPYGIKINEQNGAKWEENAFIGRPEPIFTYQHTTRTANLDFKIIVDHPSVLNLLVREHFKNMTDEESDNYINAFFAGCEELDFYDLIKRYSSLDSSDISMIKSYLDKGADSDVIKTYRTKVDPIGNYVPTTNRFFSQPVESTLYFGNDMPSKQIINDIYSQDSFNVLFNNYTGSTSVYLSELQKGLDVIKNTTIWDTGYTKDYRILTNKTVTTKPSVDDLNIMTQNVNQQINDAFTESINEYNTLITNIEEIKAKLNKGEIKNINLAFISSTSAVADVNYNISLSYRRSHSVIKDVLTRLSLNGNIDDAMSKFSWKNKITDETVSYQTEFLDENKIKIPFSSLGYKDYDGYVEINMVINAGESISNTTINNKNITCGDENLPVTSVELQKYSPASFWCRQTTVKMRYIVKETIDGTNPTSKIIIEEIDSKKTTKPNIDVLKKIVMKVLGECYYFKKLEEESPLQFSSLTEKLRYFHPSFHSMTPEGLNTRLTFLHQCLRPGDTIPIKGISDINDINARNTSFGPPPIVIFRFGDFYHTKAIIRDYNITFDETIWDLNPEGIGVQPMIANVSLTLSLIGGQGMKETVNELQNALSSNFYANTEVYDYRSTSTEDRDKFNEKKLGEILNYEKIKQKYGDNQNTLKIIDNNYIGEIDNSKTHTADYTLLIMSYFKQVEKYFNSFSSVYKNISEKYGNRISTLILSEQYRVINQYNITTDISTELIKLFGNYSLSNSLTQIVSNFKTNFSAEINDTDILQLLGVNLLNEIKSLSNSILRKYIIDKMNIIFDMILMNETNVLEKNRNNLIITLDKLNFMMEVNHDGQIIDSIYHPLTINNFDKELFYNQYSKLTSFINTTNNSFENSFDKSTNFLNTTFTDDEILYFMSVFLNNDDIDKILVLHKNRNQKVFNKKTLKKIKDGIKSICITPIPIDIKITNYPIMKNETEIVFDISEINDYVFTSDQIVKLEKINTISKNNTTINLNYYRQ